MKLIKITVCGFFTSVARIQNCTSCTSTARERYNLTPCMGWIHETVTAASCRLFCRHSRLGAAADIIQIKTQYFVVFYPRVFIHWLLDKWPKRKSIKLRCCKRSLQCLLKSNYVFSASSVYPATLVMDDTYSGNMVAQLYLQIIFFNIATFALKSIRDDKDVHYTNAAFIWFLNYDLKNHLSSHHNSILCVG